MSFAGCGFRSIYYVGALSCILERVPRLVHGASTFGGASSGCLVAAALAVGIPIGELPYCTVKYVDFSPIAHYFSEIQSCTLHSSNRPWSLSVQVSTLVLFFIEP